MRTPHQVSALRADRDRDWRTGRARALGPAAKTTGWPIQGMCGTAPYTVQCGSGTTCCDPAQAYCINGHCQPME